MNYAHRFLYHFLLITGLFIGAIYVDIAPHYVELKRLQASHFALIEKWQSLGKSENHQQSPVFIKNEAWSKSKILMTMGSLMRLNGLMVKATEINPAKTSDQGMVVAHFVVEGNYSAIHNFVNALSKQVFLSAITHFSFKQNQDARLMINLEVVFFPKYQRLFSLNTDHSIMENPFCFDEHLFIPSSNAMHSISKSTALIPLSHLKMVGYLHQDQKILGFIALPNNTTQAVTVDSLLGQEKARVKMILPDRISLILPNKKIYDLSMKGVS